MTLSVVFFEPGWCGYWTGGSFVFRLFGGGGGVESGNEYEDVDGTERESGIETLGGGRKKDTRKCAYLGTQLHCYR